MKKETPARAAKRLTEMKARQLRFSFSIRRSIREAKPGIPLHFTMGTRYDLRPATWNDRAQSSYRLQ